MDTRTKEAVRYLGYGNHAIDDGTLALIGDSFDELKRVAGRRIVYRIFDVLFKDNDRMEMGMLAVTSRDLRKNLTGCERVIVLGATLGAGVDLLMRRYSLTDMARAVVVQACAAALLEEYLDEWQEEIRHQMSAQGFYLRPRFSPGYGDFSVSHQEMILRMLDAPKRIGLSMTDGNMLTPTKSVTALIGLGTHGMSCPVMGCESCGKTDCVYRRRTTN